MIFRRKVIHGKKKGRTIGYPTLNFNVGSFGEHHSQGVYACTLTIGKKSYRGGLYYGPKPDTLAPVLEVHVLDFGGNIYGSWVTFGVGKKIRPPKTFTSLSELKNQIAEDMRKVL